MFIDEILGMRSRSKREDVEVVAMSNIKRC
jgi:hypothetical protein